MTDTQEQSWQYRALLVLRGNETMSGSILLAALGSFAKLDKRWPSKLYGAARIREDGTVVTGYRPDPNGEWDKLAVCVGHVDQVAHSFSLLADDLKLNDADRVAMFAAVRNWITKDERIKPEPMHFTKRS